MTEPEWGIIERVAVIHKFVIHADGAVSVGRLVTNEEDVSSADFRWNENEGFNEFFLQLYKFAYTNGYETAVDDAAARW